MKFTPIAERKQTRHFSDGLRLREIYRDLAEIFSIFFTFDIFVWHLQCRDKQLQSDYRAITRKAKKADFTKYFYNAELTYHAQRGG